MICHQRRREKGATEDGGSRAHTPPVRNAWLTSDQGSQGPRGDTMKRNTGILKQLGRTVESC